MRGISDINILDEFTIRYTKIAEKYTDYIVVSGFVVISSGRTRATEDIDMIIPRMNFTNFAIMHNDLMLEGFECVQSNDPKTIFEYLDENNSVRYIRTDYPLPEMELKFAKDELDDYQLKTKVKLELTGLDIWFSSVEVNIAFKEELLKSEKDLKDAEHLRKVYDVNEQEINKVKSMILRFRL